MLCKRKPTTLLKKAPVLRNYFIGEKKVGENFVREKFSHFWKISHFSPINFSDSSHFPDQFLKLKRLSWVGLLFFQRKVFLLVGDFSNWAQRNALLVSLIHRTGCCKYTPSWISLNITRKMDIWDVRVIARAQWFGFEWLWIRVYNRGAWKFKRSLWKNWKPVPCF